MNESEFAKLRMQLAGKFKSLRPESTDCNDSTPIHHITELPQACTPGRASGPGEDTEGLTEAGDPARGAAWEEPIPKETTGIVPRLHAATAAHGPTEQEKNAEPQAKSASTVVDIGHFSKVCRQKLNYQQSDKTAVKHIDT